MDKKLINEYINELENCDTTYNNIRDLAALYIVRNEMSTNDTVEKELSDILPAYKLYIDNKRRYQLGQLDKDSLLNKLNLLCIEIFEFITTIYRNTDSEEERQQIQKCLQKLSRGL